MILGWYAYARKGVLGWTLTHFVTVLQRKARALLRHAGAV